MKNVNKFNLSRSVGPNI